MNMKSEIGKINAQLRDELKEHGDMAYETINMSVGEITETLGEITETLEREGDETARPPFGRSPACNCVCTSEPNEDDLLRISKDFIVLSRQLENATVHIETEAVSISVDVCRLDSAEPQPLTHHPQPASKTSEENSVAKEKAQSGNGVKDRIWGLMGKIHVVVQTVSNSIKIWEVSQAVSLIGLGMFGGS